MNREAEIAWAAGIFEGEGCVSWVEDGLGRHHGRIVVAMTDRDVVERFAAVCGAHTSITVFQQRGVHAHYKARYTHAIQDAESVHRVLNLFLPYLCERRRADAQAVLTATEQRWEEKEREQWVFDSAIPQTEDEKRKQKQRLYMRNRRKQQQEKLNGLCD